MRTLGIIPARSGSKSIANKNITPLAGIPLIAYTIKAANASSKLSRTIVSTDSKEIADVCLKYDADVPFMRPAELAQDETPTLPVIIHALTAIKQEFDLVMILQPTSPLREPADIDKAISMLEKDPAADSVISVVKVGDHHPARMKMVKDGVLIDPPFAESMEGQRRQDLPAYYLRNGAIYLTRSETIIKQKSLKGKKSLAYVMPEERSVNIDSEIDIVLAEVLIKKNRSR